MDTIGRRFVVGPPSFVVGPPPPPPSLGPPSFLGPPPIPVKVCDKKRMSMFPSSAEKFVSNTPSNKNEKIRKFISAIKRGNSKVVYEMIRKDKEIVNMKDAEGKTGLMHALLDDKFSIVEEILRSSNPDFGIVNRDGNNVVHLAMSSCKYNDIRRILLPKKKETHMTIKNNNLG